MRVLVIDSYCDAADTLQEILEHRGHEVEVTYSGEEGVAALSRGLPELVICDLALRDGYGFDMCAALRQLRISGDSRSICWTGMLTAGVQDQAQALGFEIVVPKPHLELLLKAIGG